MAANSAGVAAGRGTNGHRPRGIGTTFADLLATGFAFARALSLARGEILAGRDSVVVGDGTHRLRPARGEPGGGGRPKGGRRMREREERPTGVTTR
ncbi:hypothetical protein BRC75_03355, partial [Halobacteriales archaeon QH_7_69_31]